VTVIQNIAYWYSGKSVLKVKGTFPEINMRIKMFSEALHILD